MLALPEGLETRFDSLVVRLREERPMVAAPLERIMASMELKDRVRGLEHALGANNVTRQQ